MNEPMKADDFLKQVEKIDRMIKNKFAEVERWKEIACGTTGGGTTVAIKNKQGKTELHNMEKVQSSGKQDIMAEAVINFVDIEKEIFNQIRLLYQTKKDVISVIEKLDVDEYDLLHLLYIQCLTPYEARTKLNKSKTWFSKTFNQALQNVQTILNEREKAQKVAQNPLAV